MKIKRFLLIIISFCSALLIVPINAQETSIPDSEIKPALIVIDIQNEFLKYMSEDDKRTAMDMINAAIVTFRQMKLPIIRVYHTNPGWGPNPGTEPFEYPKSILVTEEDQQVTKNYPNAFTKTNLDKILKEKGCNTLFLCGLSAVGCVLATYYGAADRDYKVFMFKEGLISHNSQYTNVVKDICESVSFATMNLILEKSFKK